MNLISDAFAVSDQKANARRHGQIRQEELLEVPNT